MPLRDHFRPPLDPLHKWSGFHAQWPAMMVLELVKSLPAGYFAEPRLYVGGSFEVDVGAVEPFDLSGNYPSSGDGGVALATDESVLTLEVDLTDSSDEVLIFSDDEGRRLVAAVELVSPANKDRLETRHAFVAKCAALLQQQVCVAIVDTVTVRQSNLYLELLEFLDRDDPVMGKSSPGIYAVSCRNRKTAKRSLLELRRHELKLGQPLPTLPLWLSEDLSIPLDLEASYEATCRALRIA